MYCITSVSMVEKSLQGSEPAGKPHRRPCCAGKPRDDVDGTRLFHAFLASRKWRCSPAMQDESDESEMMPWHPWDLITLRSSMLPLHWQKLTGYWSPVEPAWAQILAWTPTKVCAIRVLTMISFVELSCCMTSQHCFTAFGWAAFWNIGALRRMKAFRSWRICCEKEPIWVECIFTLATWMVTWDTGALHPAVLCLLIHFFPRCHPPPKKNTGIHKASMFVCQPRTAAGFSFVWNSWLLRRLDVFVTFGTASFWRPQSTLDHSVWRAAQTLGWTRRPCRLRFSGGIQTSIGCELGHVGLQLWSSTQTSRSDVWGWRRSPSWHSATSMGNLSEVGRRDGTRAESWWSTSYTWDWCWPPSWSNPTGMWWSAERCRSCRRHSYSDPNQFGWTDPVEAFGRWWNWPNSEDLLTAVIPGGFEAHWWGQYNYGQPSGKNARGLIERHTTEQCPTLEMMLIRRGLCATTHGDYLLPMAEICTQTGSGGEVKDSDKFLINHKWIVL